MNPSFWRGKSVLVTGHTGFKGGWLAAWLHMMGARVTGYALEPPTSPSLFEAIRLDELIDSRIGDIRDLAELAEMFKRSRPEIVLHLAAQPLVLASYEDPIGTYATNILGTAHVLECVRKAGTVRACVIVATDKCYENREWVWGYREDDRLGGHDPYSSSKACAEMVVDCYRRSFFGEATRLASVRAGNVVGGGDWGRSRLMPDLVRAAVSHETLTLRHPEAVRPWQFVLDPLRGYLAVVERMYRDPHSAGAWNFGPDLSAGATVREVVNGFVSSWGGELDIVLETGVKPHEANVLRLDSTKARLGLGWKTLLDFREMLEWTVTWYKRHHEKPSSARDVTFDQLGRFAALG